MNNNFNINLQNIKRFDFRFGNAFCGIKKLAIFFNDGVKIKSNSGFNLNFEPDKNQIITELKEFCFSEWNKKYENKHNPILENAWSIELKIDDERIEFMGLDAFPKSWQKVEDFVKKYGGFTEIKL
jgi:hypothetical protein